MNDEYVKWKRDSDVEWFDGLFIDDGTPFGIYYEYRLNINGSWNRTGKTMVVCKRGIHRGT